MSPLRSPGPRQRDRKSSGAEPSQQTLQIGRYQGCAVVCGDASFRGVAQARADPLERSPDASVPRLKFVPELWYTWVCQELDVGKLFWS
jgi:hypothetical protein